MEYPKFKVCVRCFTFNQEKYIEDAMNGFVMQQTDFPFVCCIVDDASTDGEQEVIKKYMDMHFDYSPNSVSFEKETDYAYIYYAQHKENKNCYFAVLFLKENLYSKKEGFKKIGYISEWRDICEYEAICEGDDYWISCNKLKKQVTFLDRYPQYSMCFTDVYDFDQTLQKFSKSPLGRSYNENMPVGKKELFYYILLGNCRIQTLTVVLRISFLNKVKNNSRKFMMGDTPMWFDLSQIGPIKFFEEKMGVYRIVMGSTCRNPKTQLYFNQSMFDMRIYYCEKYNYTIPNIIKRKYNLSLIDLLINDKKAIEHDYRPLYKMNCCELMLVNMVRKIHCLYFLFRIWCSLEFRINNFLK